MVRRANLYLEFHTNRGRMPADVTLLKMPALALYARDDFIPLGSRVSWTCRSETGRDTS